MCTRFASHRTLSAAFQSFTAFLRGIGRKRLIKYYQNNSADAFNAIAWNLDPTVLSAGASVPKHFPERQNLLLLSRKNEKELHFQKKITGEVFFPTVGDSAGTLMEFEPIFCCDCCE
jgi:hypothetical protein